MLTESDSLPLLAVTVPDPVDDGVKEVEDPVVGLNDPAMVLLQVTDSLAENEAATPRVRLPPPLVIDTPVPVVFVGVCGTVAVPEKVENSVGSAQVPVIVAEVPLTSITPAMVPSIPAVVDPRRVKLAC